MTGTDWQGGAKLQNSTSFYYFATDQWRSEEVDTAPLVTQNETPRYRHPGDYNVLAARLSWLPSYPTFNKGGQQIFDDAHAAGFDGLDGIRKYVAQSLKNKSLQFAVEDPDAPENFPRNLFIWRNNLIGSSSKGHDYFLKYLLGTKNSLFAEEESPIKPTEIKYRSISEISKPGGALEGKLDLLVDVDFRMASSALYADVVLPTATWYEKTDLSSTDMHPFVHPFQPAVDPLWEARTDWDIFRTLAKAVSKVAAETKLPMYKDVMAVPIQHDSEGETAQPEGKILDWSKGDCEPVPGKTMPTIVIIERDYTKIYTRNGVIEDKNLISRGMPSIYEAKQACDAVMGLSTTTNGSVAVRA